MESMQVPMTESLRGFVEKQAAKRGFSSPADFVHSVLLDMENRDKTTRDLEEKLLEGVRSPMIEADEAFWRELEHSLIEQFPELKSCDD